MGYSLDAIAPEQEPSTHKKTLIQTLTAATYNAMASTLMTQNLWHMRDFTHPSGTHLDTWDNPNYNKWEMQNGTQRKTKPRWYEALKQETLIDPTAGSDRTLIKDYYRDSPREIDTLRPFCFHEEDVRHARHCIP
jgi:hypothetical protein